MRSPILRVAAGLLLLTACGKKKDGPTYQTTGARDAGGARAVTLLLVSVTPVGTIRAG